MKLLLIILREYTSKRYGPEFVIVIFGTAINLEQSVDTILNKKTEHGDQSSGDRSTILSVENVVICWEEF